MTNNASVRRWLYPLLSLLLTAPALADDCGLFKRLKAEGARNYFQGLLDHADPAKNEDGSMVVTRSNLTLPGIAAKEDCYVAYSKDDGLYGVYECTWKMGAPKRKAEAEKLTVDIAACFGKPPAALDKYLIVDGIGFLVRAGHEGVVMRAERSPNVR